jgi:sugar-specific transcriptional regulator TrmB
MSRKRIVSTLTSLGLSREEIRIYVFLSMEGPQETKAIEKAMKINENELGSRLEILKNRGLVTIINNIIPSLFSVIPFENALDLLVETNLKQAQNTEQNKRAILEDWFSFIKESKK